MKLRDILENKGSEVRTITPDASLQDAVDLLVRHAIGSLVVCRGDSDKDAPLGIVTERDILHACTAGRQPLAEIKVAEAMSTNLTTGSPNDELEHVMGLMTTRHIRHLPVLVAGRLEGIISIGDVVKAQHDRLVLENRLLKDYISG